MLKLEQETNGVARTGRISSLRENLISFLPAAVSLTKEVFNYREAFREAPLTLRKYLKTGSPMLVCLWAYSQISGRNIQVLQQEGVLYPASILYATVADQDDILDSLRIDDQSVSSKEAFWYRGHKAVKIAPRDRFSTAISLIDSNPCLASSSRKYMKMQIAQAYRGYTQAEDTLAKLAGRSDFDISSVHSLRWESYGRMAQALSSVLNGDNCRNEDARNVEDRMAWFIIASEIVDSEIDKEEDRPFLLTLPLVGEQLDIIGNQKIGTTSKRLLSYYLDQTQSPQVKSLMLFIHSFYPKMEAGAELFDRLTGEDSFLRLHLQRGTELPHQ